MSSTTEITDALVNQLKSQLGAENVRKDDYEILARRRPWAAIVTIEGGDIRPHQFGSAFRKSWAFRVALYISARAAGEAPASKLTDGIDRVVQAILDDPTIGGTVNKLDRIAVAYVPGQSLDISGIHWYPVTITVHCSVW